MNPSITPSTSKNDLFAIQIPSVPEPSPPRPHRSTSTSISNSLGSLQLEQHQGEPSSMLVESSTSHGTPSSYSPRTSSFFDTSFASGPSPAPRLTPASRLPASTSHNSSFSPSPLSLSRAPSLRRKHAPPPPPISLGHADAFLSPLHQSPSLLPTSASSSDWRPPLPPDSDDIALRFSPTPGYALGEGRYAQVYLASYKGSAISPRSSDLDTINPAGDGYTGGNWHLCAAKRMAPDRESQTMGLREAFFLNRLTPKSSGSVYVVKLIAVKEDTDSKRGSISHGRSTSDALQPPRVVTRQRSSTFGTEADTNTLSPSPSMPALAAAAQACAATPPAISRLVLLLEHAPLGTLDRLLRTSPGIVGRSMWERWARQSSEALAWVHQKGVVHADVKPGNLLLTMDLNLRLSDFGSSLLIHPDHPPTDGVGLGTLPFSPPELVNPSASFSFPVDIFALGATLYQCITGREPFRGVRTMEMMHRVRKGGLWAWEEQARLGRIGDDASSIGGGSPYPSAWRDQAQEGLRRGGSLRVPTHTSIPRPPLSRMSSAESLRASDDVVSRAEISPPGVKLWAKWVKQPSMSHNESMRALLGEEGDVFHLPSSLRPIPSRSPSRGSSGDAASSPISPLGPAEINLTAFPPYEDGSPAMVFLDGLEALREEVREVIRMMVDPIPENRPTADELRDTWTDLGIPVVTERRRSSAISFAEEKRGSL